MTSIVNVRDNDVDQLEGLNYTQIFPNLTQSQPLISSEQLQLFKQKLFSNPLFENNIFNKNDSTSTVVLIQNDNQIWNTSPYRIELVDGIKSILDEYPRVQQYALAGTTVVNAELNRAAKRDVWVFYILISFLLILFGGATLKSFKDLCVMLLVVCCSIIPSMGLLNLLGITYNMVTAMLPTILISLSVAGVIHIINEFHRLHKDYDVSLAIQKTIRHLWKPHASTALTTIIGFATLSLSSVNPIFHLGVFAGIGIFLGWLASLTIAPVLLVMFWGQTVKADDSHSGLLRRWLAWVVKSALSHASIKVLILLLALIPASGIFFLETDTDYTKFFKGTTDVSQAYQRIDEAAYAQNPINIVLRFPKGKTWSDSAYFKNIIEFEQALEQLPEVIKLMSASKLVEQLDLAFNNSNASKQTFKSYHQNQINQLLLLGELSNNDDINDFLLKSKRQTQIVALTPYMSTRTLDRFKQQVYDLQERFLPADIELVITGTTVLWANMDTQVSRTQQISILGVGSFLIVYLIIFFRSFKLGLIGIVVNALPLAITLGVMGWSGIKINMATAIIGGISLGIVVDDTIHFISGFRIRLNQGMSIENAIVETLKTVGNSILMTSVILIGGFSCLAASDFLPSAHFGIFISLAITIALILDLFIVPAMLILLKPKPSKKILG